jgi:integrase
MKKNELLNLFKEVKAEMIALGLSDGSLRNYEYNGFRPILEFFSKENETVYSANLTKKCVLNAKKQCEYKKITHEKFRSIRKIATILEEYNKNKSIRWKHLIPYSNVQLCQYYNGVLINYISEKESIYSTNTMNNYKSIIFKFLYFLEQKCFKNFLNVSIKEINEFIPFVAVKRQFSMKGVLTALNSFIVFLNDNQFSNIDIFKLSQIKPSKRKKIFPGFSHEEANTILESVNRNNNIGKRDFAILLTIKNTGLRSIDIVNLKLDNIKWNNNEIHINQHKTNRLLTLPLDCKVGNAIADYILHGRPHSESSYIFLSCFPPYEKFSNHGALYAILSKYMKIAGINHSIGDRKGTHSFRRSIGTWMLEAGVSLSTISEVLGHSNPNSSKPYISTSTEKLRECALGLDGIEVKREDLL